MESIADSERACDRADARWLRAVRALRLAEARIRSIQRRVFRADIDRCTRRRMMADRCSRACDDPAARRTGMDIEAALTAMVQAIARVAATDDGQHEYTMGQMAHDFAGPPAPVAELIAEYRMDELWKRLGGAAWGPRPEFLTNPPRVRIEKHGQGGQAR